jgi:hypothetical protein
MTEHGTQYIEGLLVGIQQNQVRTEVWLQKFEASHKEDLDAMLKTHKDDMVAIGVRLSAVEERMTHDRATRAAWNQLVGAFLAVAGIAVSFFSGAFNHLFH